jgi:hypothetical protein
VTVAAIVGVANNQNGTGAGVFGESKGRGAGVAGVNKAAQGAAGVVGESESREGIFGVSRSSTTAAVAGIAENQNGTGAGVFGESRGKGPGVFGRSVNGLAGLFEGNVTVTGDIFLANQDIAEEFAVSDADAEPGTVLVAADADAGTEACHTEYDTRVIGVVAGAGTFKPAIVLGKQANVGRYLRVPVTILGKAFCKADASERPIQIGDVVTTARTPGHLISAEPSKLVPGAMFGKALAPLASGRGLIPVLVLLR